MNYGNLSIEEKAFFYSSNQYKNAIFEQAIEFDKNIDKEKLSIALKETIKYFIRFGMKAVITKEGKIELVENNEEFPIFDDNDQKFNIGTKETNGYLYALCIKNSKLRIVIFHVLCDGRGSGYFMRYLILNYIKLVYPNEDVDEEIKKIKIDDENHKMNLSEVVIPYVDANLINQTTKPFEYQKKESVFIVDKEVRYFYDNSYFSTNIEWDAKALLDIVHKYETTPFVFFFMLIAEAMIEIFDVNEEEIISNVAVDLRKFLDCASFYNFGTSINVEYKTKWHNFSIEDKIVNLKETFVKELDYNKIVADVYKVEKMMEKIENIQNVDWLKVKRDENFGKINYPPFSCFISNVGKVNNPEVITRHIKKPITFSTPNNVVPDYTIFTYDNVGVLTQNQNFQSEKIMQKVFEYLENFGIKSQYISEKKIEISHFDTLRLERL